MPTTDELCLLTFSLFGSFLLFVRLRGDAHVVVQGELVTVEHGGPREPVVLHRGNAPSLDLLAQRPARVDRPLQTQRGEQGAQE